jgi:hypothetical protein
VQRSSRPVQGVELGGAGLKRRCGLGIRHSVVGRTLE